MNNADTTPPARQNVRFFYVRSQKRTVTFVREIHGDKMYVAWAVSNPMDNFVKAHGRHIAVARLAKKPIVVDYNRAKPIEDMINAAINEPTFPDSAKRLVEKHMKTHTIGHKNPASSK